jgi:hypothetical protein
MYDKLCRSRIKEQNMTLFLSSFILDKGEYDDDFYRLDGWIENFTKTLTDFIGMESYTDTASGRIINNYYWRSREAMETLMTNVEHQKAKQQNGRWLEGYQVVIAQIEGAHNHHLSHPLANYPLRYSGIPETSGQ